MVLANKRSPSKPMSSGLLTPLFFGFLVLALILITPLVAPVKAETSQALNVSDWHNLMSEALGFSDSGFVGGVVLTLILCALCVFPIVLMTRKRNWGEYPEIIMLFMGLIGGVALQWVSYWILLVVVLIVALLYSSKIKDWASGG